MTSCFVSTLAIALCCRERVVAPGGGLFGGFTFNKQPDVSAMAADDNRQSEAALSDKKTHAKPEETKANPCASFSFGVAMTPKTAVVTSDKPVFVCSKSTVRVG